MQEQHDEIGASLGSWEEREFSAPLYGRVRFTSDRWPPDSDLPTKEMIWHIDVGVRRLLARLARSGWRAIESTDTRRMWKAGRVAYTLTATGLFSGTHEVALRRVRVRCRRWVPSGNDSQSSRRSPSS